jgi:hypothetical protein
MSKQSTDFFHLSPVSITPVVHLVLRISPRIFEKIEMALIGYPRARGKLIHKKTEVENLVALSLQQLSKKAARQ